LKRSEINRHLKSARAFFDDRGFALPPWADWTVEDWLGNREACGALFAGSLGWDLTDFGSEDYEKRGLMLFTLRNGNSQEPGKTYAEKIMVVGEGQETPLHFHWDKTEDIINRGGGNLIVEIHGSDEGEGLTDADVTVMVDALPRTVAAGEPIRLGPGESITLTTGLYHRFYGEPGRGRVLVGEVSRVNDDEKDNRFYESLGRFPDIQEDQAPWRLLVGDYAALLGEGTVP